MKTIPIILLTILLSSCTSLHPHKHELLPGFTEKQDLKDIEVNYNIGILTAFYNCHRIMLKHNPGAWLGYTVMAPGVIPACIEMWWVDTPEGRKMTRCDIYSMFDISEWIEHEENHCRGEKD